MEETLVSAPAGPIRPYRHEAPLFSILAIFSVLIWVVLSVATVGVFLAIFLVVGLLALFGHSLLISWLRGNAIQVDAQQCPDLHADYVACCDRLGLTRRPDLYLVQADGMLNALATRFLRRYYVVLLSDIVDALEDRPQAVRFYMGHELGHVRHKHLARHWWMWPGRLVPLLSPAYARAQEYTCDRYGAACCTEPDDARRALAVLAAGSRRWKHIDLARFQAQAQQTGGFWMAVNELTGHYPWLSKRMAAVENPDVRFPRRSVWAWVIALFSPPFGYGSALLGFLNTLLVGVLLAAVVFFAVQGPLAMLQAVGAVNSALEGLRGKSNPHEEEPEAESKSEEEQAALPDANIEEVNETLKAATLAVDQHAAAHKRRLPETLEDAGIDSISKSESVGDLSYVVPDPGQPQAVISTYFVCKTCGDELGALQYSRDAKGKWSCTAIDVPEDQVPKSCTPM